MLAGGRWRRHCRKNAPAALWQPEGPGFSCTGSLEAAIGEEKSGGRHWRGEVWRPPFERGSLEAAISLTGFIKRPAVYYAFVAFLFDLYRHSGHWPHDFFVQMST